MKNNFIILIFLVIFSGSIYSQSGFVDGVSLFKEKKYLQSLEIFNNIINESPQNPSLTAAIIFKIKILNEQKKTGEAKTEAIDFLNNFPSSKYIDEARLLLAEIYFQEKDYDKSLIQLLNIIENSDSLLYINEAVSAINNLALEYLTPEHLKSKINSYRKSYTKELLTFLTAQLQIDQRNYNDALNTLKELLQKYPDSDFKEGAELLISQISGNKLTGYANSIVCVMLPLTGLQNNDALTASKEILEGIRFAVDEFNSGRDDKIGIIVRDTENEEEKIIEIKEEITNDPSVKVVLGPVFSSEVEIALEEFNSADIPLMSPTATDNDLTQLNKNFFQANPNFIIRAKAIAQYIYFVENKRNMAVLNSIDGYSPLLAAEFISEFERLGGNISAKYTYKSENLYSDIEIDTTQLLSAEGLYIPISNKSDAPLIFSQLVKNNVSLPLYGNQDWFQAKGFETSPELSNKMIFTSDYFIEYNSSLYQDFNKKFVSKTGLDANRNVLYGYDSAKYILTILRNISRDRKTIKLKMESGTTVTGFHNNISFNDDRVNLFMNIVRYNEGYFELVDKFKVGK